MRRLKRRTLVGRIAAVQTAVTLLSLAAVLVATSAAVTAVLGDRVDRTLGEVAERVSSFLGGQRPADFDRAWIEDEIEELRPSSVRVEVRTEDAVLAEAGPRLDLPDRGIGCASHGEVRLCAILFGPFTVVAAASQAEELAARNALIVAMAITTILGGAVVVVLSRSVTRRTLRPLSDLAKRIAAIEPGEGGRLDLPRGLAELDSLSSRFDELVSRFEEALARERRLTAHASHELRTPLTVARAEVESIATAGADPAACRRALAALDHLTELIEALLWFARAQVRLDDDSMEIVNIADLLRTRTVPHGPFSLPDEVLVRGDEHLLARVIANLIDNAEKYGDGGTLGVRARRDGAVAAITIANRIDGRERPTERVFEPFFRGHSAPVVRGFGLGLPFARAVARAHGGDVALGEMDDRIVEFVLRLPFVVWSEQPADR